MLDSDSPTAGDRLLRLFDNDPVVAAEKLLRCREKLVHRFSAERCHDPGNLASKTIERVLDAIEREPHRVITDIWVFVSGVARNIIHETHRSPIHKEVPLGDLSPTQEPRTTPLEELLIAIAEQEDLHDCLKQCLEKFNALDRELLIRYYDAEESEKLKQTRVRLALSLRLTSTRLTKLAFNLRKTLEACIKNCLDHRNKTEKSS